MNTELTSTKEVLIIDCQLFQNDTFNRGMGRYSLRLIETFFRQNADKLNNTDVYFLFNTKEIADDRRKVLTEIYRDAKFVTLDFPGYQIDYADQYIKVYESFLDKWIYENFKSRQIKFVILSLFEGSFALSAFPTLPNCEKLLLMYDIIPHLFSFHYLAAESTLKDYYSRFKVLFNADKIFTISDTTRNDICTYLSIPSEKVFNIDGALINNQIDDVKDQTFDFEPFILCVSGVDWRKNNEGMIRAFSEFSKKNKYKYTLVFTSTFLPQFQEIYYKIDPKLKLKFLGHVEDDVLENLYKKSLGLFFAPKYEGLGLPVLEAVKYDKQMVISEISVFKEMSEDAFLYSDPYSIESMAKQLEFMSKNPELSQTQKKKYDAIKKHYTWERSAAEFASGFNKKIKKENKDTKAKIAIVGPGFYGYSAITKFLEDILPHFSNHEVHYYQEHGLASRKYREAYSPFIWKTFDVDQFDIAAYGNYDYVIYNIGNSEFHVKTWQKATLMPGICVFHDLHIDGMLNFAMQHKIIPTERVEMEKSLHKTSSLVSVLNSSISAICHSDFAKKELEDLLVTNIPINKINLASSEVTSLHTRESDKVRVGLAGLIAEVKGLDFFLDFATKLKDEGIQFVVFGYDFNNISSRYKEQIEQLNIEWSSNLSEFEFQRLLSSLDILVNYRSKYNGETSKSTIDAMRYGVVPVVRDIGWFSELPSDVAIKLNAVSEIEDTLLKFVSNKNDLIKRKEVSRNHSNNFSCEGYVSAVEEILQTDYSNYSNPNLVIRNLLRQGHMPTKELIHTIFGSL